MPDNTLETLALPFAEPIEDFTLGREEEALFARDENDVLVRREKETLERFKDLVTITIDGYPVEVPRAVPKTDAQGNPLRGPSGELIPRTTTIYDAAARLVSGYTDSRGQWVRPVWSEDELKRRIPVLCHQPHLNPVGVCRMCSVHISSIKKGKLTPGRKLVPSCQHRVEKDMVVTTQAGAEGYNPALRDKADLEAVGKYAKEVGTSVRLLVEFLLADHRHPDPSPVPRYENELEAVARTLQVVGPRPRLPRNPGGDDGRNALNIARRGDPSARHVPLDGESLADAAGVRYARARRIELPLATTALPPERVTGPAAQAAQIAWEMWNRTIDEKFPYSSRTVAVDHDRCILCDRCVRSCSEVKPFKVIGHTGKGYNARISFDLDALMGESTCVQCGECMTACPTGALSLRRRVQPRAWDDSPDVIPQHPNTPFPAESGFLTADEIRNVWLYYDSPARGPRVVFPFRSVPYAYLKWNEGSVRRWEIPAGERRVLCKQDDFGSTAFLLQGTGKFHIHIRPPAPPAKKPGLLARLLGRTSGPAADGGPGPLLRTVPGNQLVLGEMACLTHRARAATVIAEADPEVPALELAYDTNGWPTARVRKKDDQGRPIQPVAVVYEVTRNLLDMMQRAASARDDIEEVYTAHALETCLYSGKLFGQLTSGERKQIAGFLLEAGLTREQRTAADRFVRQSGLTPDQVYEVGRFLATARFSPEQWPAVAEFLVETRLTEERRQALAAFLRAPARSDPAAEKKRVTDLLTGELFAPLGPEVQKGLSRCLLFGGLSREQREAMTRAMPGLIPGRPSPEQREAVARFLVETKLTPEQCGTVGAFIRAAGDTREERDAVARYLVDGGLVFRRVAAGETVVAEGDPASDFYILRVGSAEVYKTVGDRKQVQARLGADDYFGEVALLADELRERGVLPPGMETHRRSATVAALDPVELIRVPGTLFLEMCDRFPDVRAKLIEGCEKIFAGGGLKPPPGVLSEYVHQGLFQGQRLLVLDLTRCTRCDECTRACADSHQHLDAETGVAKPGHARLLREGMRFGDYLVATSCRSCQKPYCMEGCPVDAIHRHGNRLEVVIEDHCIGCGLCERNCPYGAIQMVSRAVPNAAAAGAADGNPHLIAATSPRKAVNCDLCGPVGGEPFCVSACPHEAAFRVDGPTLLHEVTVRATGQGRFSVA